MDKYSFTINGQSCNPQYSEDLSKVYTLENDEVFYTESLSGNLTFVGNDFDYIVSQPFNTKFLVNIYLNGALYFAGYFTRVDATDNYDDRTIVTSLTADSSYDAVVNNLDKEYNIVELLPYMSSIEMSIRPVVQIYATNSNVLSCFLGGNIWEQTVSSPIINPSTLLNTYRFGRVQITTELIITRLSGSVNNPQLYGTWYRTGPNTLGGRFYKREDSAYYIVQEATTNEPYEQLTIRRTSNNQALYISSPFIPVDILEESIYFNPAAGSGATGQLNGEASDASVYARLLLGGDPNDGSTVYPVPNNDISTINKNYTHVQPYTTAIIELSTRSSTTPTEFGRNNDGNYFLPPLGHDNPGQRRYPVARDRWINNSIWYRPDVNYDNVDLKRVPYKLQDAYDMKDVIDALLKQINPNYYFNSAGSEFFYRGTTIPPMVISSGLRQVLFTHKTNILKSRYDVAAQKANVSLKSIFDMLYSTYRCKWHMEGNALRIEHLAYYMWGRDYYNRQIGIDLTNWRHPKHFQDYSYGQDTAAYDKSELYEFTDFEFAEDLSEAFSTLQIKANDEYIQKGKTNRETVSNFNPDVDYMLANPTAFSNDGFVLFAAAINVGGETNASWILPFETWIRGNTKYTMQNSDANFKHLVRMFHEYDTPGLNLEVPIPTGGTAFVPKQTKLMRKQSLWFIERYANLYTDPEPHKIVRVTNNQVGIIEKMSVNLTTRKIEIDLKYGLLDF